MKRVFAAMLLFLCCLSLFASVAFGDIGISFGHGNFLFDSYEESGAGVMTGLCIGLTERLELDLQAQIMLTPHPFGTATVGLELAWALLGERVFDYDNAGLGINTLISIGLWANDHNPGSRFVPGILTLRITPLTDGSPRTGRRERILPVGVAWNFCSGEVTLFFSAFILDFYR